MKNLIFFFQLLAKQWNHLINLDEKLGTGADNSKVKAHHHFCLPTQHLLGCHPVAQQLLCWSLVKKSESLKGY